MVVQNVVFLAQDNCRTLCRNTLDVERVSIGEVVLDLIQYLKDFACKSDAFIGVTDVTKLIRLGVTKCLDDFIQTKDTHCAVLLVHLDRAILIVGEQSLLNVPLDDMANSTVTVTPSTPDGVAKRYNIKQTATNLDVNIDIPKDMVVESGTVETKAEAGAWGEAGTYLHLVLANATEDNIYINVGSLIEYVTSGSKVGDQIVIDVSADHKVTATLTEGSVTLAQLHADVQTAIGKAHSHTNKAELDKIVTGDKAKWDAAEQKAHEHGNKTILDAISQDKVDAWDGAVTKQHEHANKTVLDGISAEKVADWDSKAAGNHEHDITELKQASGYIVFNCGSASVNI